MKVELLSNIAVYGFTKTIVLLRTCLKIMDIASVSRSIQESIGNCQSPSTHVCSYTVKGYFAASNPTVIASNPNVIASNPTVIASIQVSLLTYIHVYSVTLV